MNYRLEFHQEALKDINEASQWYESQRSGLGSKFEVRVIERLNQIAKNPTHYHFTTRPYRVATIDVFPYSITFEFEKSENTIYIHSIHHHRRKPGNRYRRFK